MNSVLAQFNLNLPLLHSVITYPVIAAGIIVMLLRRSWIGGVVFAAGFAIGVINYDSNVFVRFYVALFIGLLLALFAALAMDFVGTEDMVIGKRLAKVLGLMILFPGLLVIAVLTYCAAHPMKGGF